MYSIGQKVMLTKLIGSDKEYGYKFGDIITIKDIILRHEYPYKDDKGHPFAIDQLAPVFEIGDTVEFNEHMWLKSTKGKQGIIDEYNSSSSIRVKPFFETCFDGGIYASESELKLIRKGAGMARSLRDRIEALTGWDKEADDILREIIDTLGKGNYHIMISGSNKNGTPEIRIYEDYASLREGRKMYNRMFNSQCSKLRAFKDALLFLLDKSGLEKDTEKEELLKQIADLKAHHEAERQRIEELERRIK